jgi:hypothetical protein
MLQLDNWKGDGGSSSSRRGAKQKPEIVLPVPAGQEELAELLIKGEGVNRQMQPLNGMHLY